MMLKSIAKIRRLHGLQGAVLVEIFENSYIDTFDMFNNFKQGDFLFVDDQKIEIEHIFGFTKNLCRMQFRLFDMERAKDLCGKYLQINYDGFDYDNLIGLPIYIDGRFYARVHAIYNFGGGIVCDTNKDMILADSLDLSKIEHGILSQKLD